MFNKVKLGTLNIELRQVVGYQEMPNGTIQIDLVSGKTYTISKEHTEAFLQAYHKYDGVMDNLMVHFGETSEKLMETVNGLMKQIKSRGESVEFEEQPNLEYQKLDVRELLAEMIFTAEFYTGKNADMKKWLTAAKKVQGIYAGVETLSEGEEAAIGETIDKFHTQFDLIGAHEAKRKEEESADENKEGGEEGGEE